MPKFTTHTKASTTITAELGKVGDINFMANGIIFAYLDSDDHKLHLVDLTDDDLDTIGHGILNIDAHGYIKVSR